MSGSHSDRWPRWMLRHKLVTCGGRIGAAGWDARVRGGVHLSVHLRSLMRSAEGPLQRGRLNGRPRKFQTGNQRACLAPTVREEEGGGGSFTGTTRNIRKRLLKHEYGEKKKKDTIRRGCTCFAGFSFRRLEQLLLCEDGGELSNAHWPWK